MLESSIYPLNCSFYRIGEEVELKQCNTTMFKSNIIDVPVNENRIKILKLEDGKTVYIETLMKTEVVKSYVIVEDGDETIFQFKFNADVQDKLKYTSISHRFHETYTRNVVLSLTYQHKTHYASVFYCDKDDMFKLEDKESSDIYLSPTEFRNAYVHSDRNGQQVSNIIVLLDEDCVGRYTQYFPFQTLYGKVIAGNDIHV